MATDIATFRAFFPEFSGVADAVVTVWLDEANSYLSQDSFGDCFDRAGRYWTAHNLALSQARQASSQVVSGQTVVSSGAGSVTSASGGGLSVSYATPSFATSGNADEVDYSKTEYGIKYMAIRDQCIGGGKLTGTQPIDPTLNDDYGY